MINIDYNNKNKCCGCNACENVCPNKSIIMVEDMEGFKYPKINLHTCTNCNLCERVCPVLACSKKKIDEFDIYACYYNDDEILKNSSSGGIFTALSEYVLDKNGVVYGAVYTSKHSVGHIKIDSLTNINSLRGSKYIQSELGDTYKKIKELLDQGTTILFTGTPCQVAGLSSFLGKKYNNLIMCDFICFGVASPKLFRKYIDFLEKKYKKSIREFNFRSKCKGWKDYGQLGSEIQFEDNTKEYIFPIYNNSFILGYSNAVTLRPICYKCPFKIDSSYSDFKIADFWGVSKIAPHMYNQKGTSMVFVNTEKGKNIYATFSNKITSQKVDYKDIVKYQPLLLKSKDKSLQRKNFMEDLNGKEYKQLERKYFNKYKWIISKVFERIIRYFK